MPLEVTLEVADFLLLAVVLGVGIRRRKVTTILLALLQAIAVVVREAAFGHSLAGGPAFRLDSLSLVMVALVAVVGPLVALYAADYLPGYEKHHGVSVARRPKFFFYLFLFLGAMTGLVAANDLNWLFFFWELTTLCSFMLISYDGSPAAEESGYLALNLNLGGGLAFALALVAFKAAGLPPFLSSLTSLAAPSRLVVLGVALLVIAGLTKAAQLPFGRWLLGAMVAPTPVSALLHSSTMVKAGVYLILRLSPLLAGRQLGTIVAVLGAVAFLATATCAVTESNGKRILAYSTIGNLGLIVVCAGLATPLSISAGIVLTVFHAISKALLFLCMGVVEERVGSRNVEDMDALLVRLPFTTLVMVVGMFSMLLPPFGVLIGKWVTMQAAAKEPVVLILVVLGSALTLLYWAKWLGRILSGQFVSPWQWEKLGRGMRAALVTLAALVVGASAGIVPLLHSLLGPVEASLKVRGGLSVVGGTLDSGAGFFKPGPVLVAVGLLIVVLPVVIARVRPAIIRAPYLCGENAAAAGLEFRSAGDGLSRAHVGSYYLGGLFPQDKVALWADVVSLALILLMTGVAFR